MSMDYDYVLFRWDIQYWFAWYVAHDQVQSYAW